MTLTFKDGAIAKQRTTKYVLEIEITDRDAESLREQLMKKGHKWKEGDRIKMQGCNKLQDDSVWKAKMEDGAWYVSTGGHYDIRCYNQDHWTLIEEKKKHKWKVGDRVKVVGDGDYHGLIGAIYNCNTCGKG